MQLKDVSVRKFRRKIRQSGFKQAMIDGTELLSRKHFAPPIYERMVEWGMINLVDENDLLGEAEQIVSFANEKGDSQPYRPFVAEFHNGYILPVTGLSFTNEFGLIGESVGHPDIYEWFTMEALIRHDFVTDHKVIPKLIFNHESLKSSSEQIDIAAPFCPRFKNYFHWVIQTLPRLRYLQQYEQETGEEVNLVVPTNYPPWLHEALSLLDVPDGRIIQSDVPIFRVNKLIIPPFLGLDTDYSGLEKQDIEWLRQKLIPRNQTTDAIDIPSRVFISREGAVERQIANRGELFDVLSQYGFTKYRLEERSLKDNIRLFNEADIVIGTHGAGLTDIVFCDECIVVELFGSKVKSHYEWLSKQLNFEYYPIHCTPKSTDLYVNVDQIEYLLSSKL